MVFFHLRYGIEKRKNYFAPETDLVLNQFIMLFKMMENLFVHQKSKEFLLTVKKSPNYNTLKHYLIQVFMGIMDKLSLKIFFSYKLGIIYTSIVIIKLQWRNTISLRIVLKTQQNTKVKWRHTRNIQN